MKNFTKSIQEKSRKRQPILIGSFSCMTISWVEISEGLSPPVGVLHVSVPKWFRFRKPGSLFSLFLAPHTSWVGILR